MQKMSQKKGRRRNLLQKQKGFFSAAPLVLRGYNSPGRSFSSQPPVLPVPDTVGHFSTPTLATAVFSRILGRKTMCGRLSIDAS